MQTNRYWIKGRASSDIIKSAGYKISALDIEQVILCHPQVQAPQEGQQRGSTSRA
jgi:acyl-coenzyme A synthetase/AMP-(fatty) acid ligase